MRNSYIGDLFRPIFHVVESKRLKVLDVGLDFQTIKSLISSHYKQMGSNFEPYRGSGATQTYIYGVRFIVGRGHHSSKGKSVLFSKLLTYFQENGTQYNLFCQTKKPLLIDIRSAGEFLVLF